MKQQTGYKATQERRSASTIPPSRAARRRAGRGGDNARRRRRTALYPKGLGESVPTHVQCGFPGTACTTGVRHPTLVRWPPIRRHRRDPRRQKTSIIPAPLEAGVSSSAWSILPTAAARPPWRSTVSQSASAMACRRRARISRRRRLCPSTTGSPARLDFDLYFTTVFEKEGFNFRRRAHI